MGLVPALRKGTHEGRPYNETTNQTPSESTRTALIRRVMGPGDIRRAVNLPCYGFRHLDIVSIEQSSGGLFVLNQSRRVGGAIFHHIAFVSRKIPLSVDHLLHSGRTQFELLLLHVEHLPRDGRRFQGSIQRCAGLFNGAHRLADVPYGLVLGLLNFHFPLPLFEHRAGSVSLGLPVTKGNTD